MIKKVGEISRKVQEIRNHFFLAIKTTFPVVVLILLQNILNTQNGGTRLWNFNYKTDLIMDSKKQIHASNAVIFSLKKSLSVFTKCQQ